MALPHNNGWDFIKVGYDYFVKDHEWMGVVSVVKDESTDNHYEFVVIVVKATSPALHKGHYRIVVDKKLCKSYNCSIQFLHPELEYELSKVNMPWWNDVWFLEKNKPLKVLGLPELKPSEL